MPAPEGNQNAVGRREGRPSLYKPEYCEDVISMGKEGKSLAQMCSHFDIGRPTIDRWADDHEEFREALSRARAHMQAHLEVMGYTGMTADRFNGHVWIKTMQARFRSDYTERSEISGPAGGPLQTEDVSTRDLAKAVAGVLAKGVKAEKS